MTGTNPGRVPVHRKGPSDTFPAKGQDRRPRFTGKEDPEIHLDSFNQSATMNGCTDEEKCLLFFQTLRNRATEWFNKLHPGSIDSFSDLASKFKAKFQENCTKRKKFTYLSTAGQRESENLTQFLTRWKEEVDKVEEMDDKTVLSLLLNGLRAGELYKEFYRKPPATYQEAYHTAWEFAEAETQLRAKREAEHGHKPKPVQVKKEEAPRPSRPRHHYDLVIRVVNTEECQEVRKAPVIPPENPTGQVGRQWSGTYCSYHRSDSHNTSECKSVKGVIRQMIDSGELGKDYLQKAQEKSHQWVRPTAQGMTGTMTGGGITGQGSGNLPPKKNNRHDLRRTRGWRFSRAAEELAAGLIGRTYPRRASWVDQIHLAKPTETQARTWHAGYYTGLAQYNRKNIKTRKRGPEEGMPARGLDLEEGSNRTYTGP
ncbi:hypothetical protein DM860_004229 [Cuscuta australis]|uniref:Retrotransposon gag domain-containing protein n=1 Tax=Cuscuta australis TaxID=267555 RepID=A0A328EAR2_9ASTE|nr:hypothetical protein DM860_004229 [Cuscuta australis]